uniref:Uncharacterized protein n=1 Tax=Glossina palpalis gambiensis TaxID=67801 RepID=A0A1B0AVQ2_9MUSC
MFNYEVNDHIKTAAAISTIKKILIVIASEIFIYTSQTSSLQIRANNIQNTNASDSSRSSSNVDNDTDADAHANADDDDNVNVAILDDSKAHFDASVTIQKNGLCSKYHTKC